MLQNQERSQNFKQHTPSAPTTRHPTAMMPPDSGHEGGSGWPELMNTFAAAALSQSSALARTIR